MGDVITLVPGSSAIICYSNSFPKPAPDRDMMLSLFFSLCGSVFFRGYGLSLDLRAEPSMDDVNELGSSYEAIGGMYRSGAAKIAQDEKASFHALQMSNARTTSEMQELLQEENEDRAQADASICGGCSERNYLVSCPEGWSEDSDGSCNPPKTAALSFSCSRKQYLQKYSTTEKQAFERRCLACYPCAVAVMDSASDEGASDTRGAEGQIQGNGPLDFSQ